MCTYLYSPLIVILVFVLHPYTCIPSFPLSFISSLSIPCEGYCLYYIILVATGSIDVLLLLYFPLKLSCKVLSTLERLIPTVHSTAGSYDPVKGSAYQSPNTASVGVDISFGLDKNRTSRDCYCIIKRSRTKHILPKKFL